MTTNVYDIYRRIQNKRKTTFDNRSASFITDGKISQDIYHIRKEKNIKSALVFDYREGPDEVSVFTFPDDELLQGDYFSFDGSNYLVIGEVKIPQEDIQYKKQKAVECNVAFSHQGNPYKAYFMSSARRQSNPDFDRQSAISPDENPLLILPSTQLISVNSVLYIEDKPWKVIEFDKISNKGIAYHYLERHFSTNIPEEEEEESNETLIEPTGTYDQTESGAAEELSLKPMTEYTFETEGAYFSSTPKVNITARSMTEISFKVPFGIDFVSISIKKDGIVIEKGYKVVL